jgi:hypothetical protein
MEDKAMARLLMCTGLLADAAGGTVSLYHGIQHGGPLVWCVLSAAGGLAATLVLTASMATALRGLPERIEMDDLLRRARR